ncbi:uncharacterized protein EAE98_001700 [Botrytis deweyae]|uniref:Uncharacterized protein n=1 Tax=Botrytis deweyae TaxID=2478750 RepID=A0ABQ7IYL6_9HELO|nr:uncharacterized protein EAE98_001700 [Botrytis deweyae]KAF7937386.1 hypothetical protein EAE98_001700 [Botrytis deweyae]
MPHNPASQRDKSGRTPRSTTKPPATKRGRRDSSLELFSDDEWTDLDHEEFDRNLNPNASIQEYFRKKDEALARQAPPPNEYGDFLGSEDLESVGILGQKLSEKRKKKKAEEEKKQREMEEAWAMAPPPATSHPRRGNESGETPSRRNISSSHRERAPLGTDRKSTPARSEPKTHHPAPSRTDARKSSGSGKSSSGDHRDSKRKRTTGGSS